MLIGLIHMVPIFLYFIICLLIYLKCVCMCFIIIELAVRILIDKIIIIQQ